MGIFGGVLTAIGTAVGGPVGGAIGGAVGGAIDADKARSTANSAIDAQNQFNSDQSYAARAFNGEQAALNRTFQWDSAQESERYNTEMSNTAYQRTTKDMIAAGINPMLAVSQGGASTPQVGTLPGSAASSPGFAQSADRVAAVSTALQATKLSQDIAESNSRIGVNNADVVLKTAQTNRETASAANLDMSTKDIAYKLQEMVPEQIRLLRAEQGTAFWRQMVDSTQVELNKVAEKVKAGELSIQEAQIAKMNAETVLIRLAQPEARNAANAQDSWWMKNVSPYLPDALKGHSLLQGVSGAIGR